ncbi:hypothetical protein EUTSA_v10022078mg [Eutrema salsugineum]|uniref:Uncharacterized protein n=1 Tax=Eutrema salsugineum TaxID=72664 RepID=V4LWX2_EUTSA|nr:hypothetical protein EUTSA_v10022078mg [Eutrema salsugineum]
MTIAATGKKCVILCLAMFLLLSSFHEVSCQSEVTSGQEVRQGSSSSEDVRRLLEGLKGKAGSDGGESMDVSGNDAENRKRLEEIERKFKESGVSSESREQYEATSQSRSSQIRESLGIGESGAWRCINQNKNGAKDDDDSPIVIPKYDINDIIKEEINQGSSSKTSSLITSLTEIVEKHKRGRWTDVRIGQVSTKETSERVTKLKTTLKSYVGIHVRDLVARSDFEEIMTMAARYEQLSSASVTYIARLATYTTVIKQGFKASQRVQTVHERVKLHENVAKDHQKRVDEEFAAVKAVAKKGDNLSVQIFAMKRLVMKLEADKRQVDVEFQKIVENLSRVLEESSHAYEKYHVVVREWKEVQSTVEYSRETIEKAEGVWVQFLNTLSH